MTSAPQDRPLAASPVHVLACGAIARETLSACDINGLGHVHVECLPAIWHNHPEKIAPALRERVTALRETGVQRIFIGYGECGTRGEIDRLCRDEGLERLPGPHCYAFYTGVERFAREAEDEFTAFYLTDMLARQFHAFVVAPLKLDRHPELIPMMFGNYEKLVFLAQTDDPDLTAEASAAAAFLGLSFERRFTGLGDLETALLSAASEGAFA